MPRFHSFEIVLKSLFDVGNSLINVCLLVEDVEQILLHVHVLPVLAPHVRNSLSLAGIALVVRTREELPQFRRR